LNAFLKAIGVHVPNVKVVHSLRHRAQDRLRAAGCPQDIREQLLGHEQMTVGEGYGKGSPVPLLKRWLDKVGF
jgi:integrase